MSTAVYDLEHLPHQKEIENILRKDEKFSMNSIIENIVRKCHEKEMERTFHTLKARMV